MSRVLLAQHQASFYDSFFEDAGLCLFYTVVAVFNKNLKAKDTHQIKFDPELPPVNTLNN